MKLVFVLFVTINLVSCILKSEPSLKAVYTWQIEDEISGDTPPLIKKSWNSHWNSTLEHLRKKNSQEGRELERFIINERRKRGLPDLR